MVWYFNKVLAGLFLVMFLVPSEAQPLYDYKRPFLATSQLGFRPQSPKELVFYGGAKADTFPASIPFYITRVGYRLPRQTRVPDAWTTETNVFRWPFNKQLAAYSSQIRDPKFGDFLYQGTLKRIRTRWGTFWKADFSIFDRPGNYQIECEYGFTAPFQISDRVYDRLARGYLEYLYSQRSGTEVPGIRPVENADDARLSSDTSYFMPVAGGWNDAGDWRKWLFLTLPNLEALGQIAEHGHPAFRDRAIKEMIWGNQYFHHMITDEGKVYEDVGGGINRAEDMDESWWNENHPGVTAAGDTDFDNIPLNEIGRQVRDHYNPLVQFQFARHQARASMVLPPPYKNNALILADRAWKYGRATGHDRRTLFLAQELLAAVELYKAGSPSVSEDIIRDLASSLFERQEFHEEGLSGYFVEDRAADGYRSIAFSCEPALALVRLVEADITGLPEITDQAKQRVTSYIDSYLLADAASNAFHIPPYGVYTDPPFPDLQMFRKAGTNRYVRTFIHVFSEHPMPHGVNQVFLQQGYLMARAGHILDQPDWQQAAEYILNWSLGTNPYGLCLFTGVGFKHPIPASFMNYKIPSATMTGFLGTPGDEPYLETQQLVEWSTQEVWDVPYFYTIGLISYLD